MSAQDVWGFLELGKTQSEVEVVLGEYSKHIFLMVSPAQMDDGADICYPDGQVMWSYRDGYVFTVGANSPSVRVNGIGVGSTYSQIAETLGQTSLGEPRMGYGTMMPIGGVTWAGFSYDYRIPPPDSAPVLWVERRADMEVVIHDP